MFCGHLTDWGLSTFSFSMSKSRPPLELRGLTWVCQETPASICDSQRVGTYRPTQPKMETPHEFRHLGNIAAAGTG